MRSITAVFALLLVLTACGSAPAATDTDTGPADETAATDAPDEPTPEPETGGNGSSGGDDACLNTVEEVSAAFGVDVSEAVNTPTPGGGGACIYYVGDQADFNVPYTSGIVVAPDIDVVFDSFAADESSESVSGIGDEAVWYGMGIIIRKGDKVLSLGATNPDELDEAAIRGILEDLARTAVDRL